MDNFHTSQQSKLREIHIKLRSAEQFTSLEISIEKKARATAKVALRLPQSKLTNARSV